MRWWSEVVGVRRRGKMIGVTMRGYKEGIINRV